MSSYQPPIKKSNKSIRYDEVEVCVLNNNRTSIVNHVKVYVPLRWDDDVKEWILTSEAHDLIDSVKSSCISKNELLDRIKDLGKLAHQSHYTCEDSWYSCPASGECSRGRGDCECGVDEHNLEVDKLLQEIIEKLK